MTENPLVEQAKQGDVNAITSLMNRLLKSQGMLANVERSGDYLEILIESDLRSLDDEMRIPKRPVLVGMIKKWFVTIEAKTVSRLKISWQQAGSEEPAWTEEVVLVEQESQETQENTNHAGEYVLGNGGLSEAKTRFKIPPLPVLPRRTMTERNEQSGDRVNSDLSATSLDLDAMFGETIAPESLQSLSVPEYLSSDIDNPQSSQAPKVLSLTDDSLSEPVDVAINQNVSQNIGEEISTVQPEEISPANNFLSQIFFQTPSLPIQFAQYLVVCAMIILTLRGFHTVFGATKAPKTTSAISTQIK
jgi:hypothetical protein